MGVDWGEVTGLGTAALALVGVGTAGTSVYFKRIQPRREEARAQRDFDRGIKPVPGVTDGAVAGRLRVVTLEGQVRSLRNDFDAHRKDMGNKFEEVNSRLDVIAKDAKRAGGNGGNTNGAGDILLRLAEREGLLVEEDPRRDRRADDPHE